MTDFIKEMLLLYKTEVFIYALSHYYQTVGNNGSLRKSLKNKIHGTS